MKVSLFITCLGEIFYQDVAKDAQKAAKQMIACFEDSEYIVTPSGSCAAMFKEYPGLFKEDEAWQRRAQVVADKTYEFTQFIVNVLGVEDVGAAYPARATYHTSCHMIRLLQEKEAPFRLLENVTGLELLPLENSYDCCGFGGTFAVKMVPISEQMVDEKIRHVEESTADILIAADSGCLMNIKGRIDRKEKPIEVKHIAQILNSRA